MITNKVLRKFTEHRHFVDNEIEKLKNKNSSLKVIDVGGGINSWCKYTTHVVDIFINEGSKEEFLSGYPDRHFFDFDITQENNWKTVLDYVEENGKFDYSICTHTLEDITNPKLVCDMLMKISKRGFISVPSKYAEYLRFENWYGVQGYRGFFHHKWIYSIKNNVFRGFEKANYWEYINSWKINKPDGHLLRLDLCGKAIFNIDFMILEK